MEGRLFDRSAPYGWGSTDSGERRSRRWRRIDWILVAVLMLVSALASFHDLGDRSAPQTFWKPGVSGDGFTVDFGEARSVSRLNLYEGPGASGKSKIEYSLDGFNWQTYAEIEHKVSRVFTWKSEDKLVEARYMRYTATTAGFTLYEAAFFSPDSTTPIPIESVKDNEKKGSLTEGSGALAFDEQSEAPYRPDYRNSMYFDEIYHGRTAYEFIEKMQPYENTHPPLGKVILSIGVELFGMTPYGWRFMAAVGGTIMIPVFYMAARGMFKRTRYAFMATLLLLFEGFHLVHSRMANVDIFGVTFTILMYYFMYLYGETKWRNGGFGKSFLYLGLSGFFFGCASAVKWNYLYGGAGLAILFFWYLYRRAREARENGDDGYAKRMILTLMSCLVLFVAVPVATYATSYIPYFRATADHDGIKDLWHEQKRMYEYHKGVKEKHPYASKWYTWPLMLRPVWYYGGKDLAPGDAQSIAAIGNPLIWWGGLAAMLAAWVIGLLRRSRIVLVIAVMYLSFYVPWMVSPRSITFLYHYFPMVPLLILSIVWILRFAEQEWPRFGKALSALTLAGAAFLCVWFYPIYTGLTISREWMNFGIRWLDSWGF
ncbi:phospholipid carrier-dependent glycosyltransferase [Cohnella sp. AR92]|uniref:phospholipid carrier-dependent glycosyltransferase n=1 Tax=Cohnella sp. AR92 TaxID=648716 RepID=UPI001315811C|nr:phospholipid carrier-dependent glycosyltransferase [Cohnella sp. AR92]